MADNGMIAATPYPFYAGGDDGDEAHKAALTSHAGASIERNQDSQFAAARSVALLQEVAYNRDATAESKFQAVIAQKDAEIRQSERFANIEKELAVLRAEGLSRDVVSLRAELAESRAGSRNDALAAVLAQILAKVSV